MTDATTIAVLPMRPKPFKFGLRRTNQGFGLIYASALLIPLLLFCAGAWWIWKANLEATYSQIERNTIALAGYTERLINIQETLLNSVLNRVQGLDWETISQSQDIHEFLIEQSRFEKTSLALTIVRPDTGRIVAWSEPSLLPNVDVSDRDYYKAHLDGGPQTFIGEVVKTRPADKIGFTVSRRDPKSGAIAVSLIEVEKLKSFYGTMLESSQDVAGLVRRDGAVLIRLPDPGNPLGRHLTKDSNAMRFMRGEVDNIQLGRGVIDGVYRYYSNRWVGHYPVVVGYGMTYDNVFNSWLRQLGPLATLSLVTMGLLFFLARLAEKSALAQRKAEVSAASARLQTANNQKLAASEMRLRHAAKAAGLTYVVLDIVNDRVFVAENYRDVMGFDVPDGLRIADSDEALLARVVEADREYVRKAIDDLDSGKADVQRIEFRVQGDDGQLRWIETNWAVGKTADGKPLQSFCTNLDVTERKQQEEHQRMLLNELNHRVKNTLASVQSIASQTLRNSPNLEEGRGRFEARLMALSKVHDVLTQQNWMGAPLKEVVHCAIAPYRAQGRERFLVDGPDVRLPPRFALALAMALHELCTNAVKYGALSNDTGRVRISWSFAKDNGYLNLRWSEESGPRVKPPERRGFGSRLIERGLASDLGGDVTIEFAESGVVCSIEAPLTQKPADVFENELLQGGESNSKTAAVKALVP